MATDECFICTHATKVFNQDAYIKLSLLASKWIYIKTVKMPSLLQIRSGSSVDGLVGKNTKTTSHVPFMEAFTCRLDE